MSASRPSTATRSCRTSSAVDLTWHSALLFGADGSRTAIVGRYDRQMVVDTGAYDRVVDYVTGFANR